MSKPDYLYLIKTVDVKKVLLVTTVETIDGVTMYEGKICDVLNHYTPPIDMDEVLSYIQKSSRSKRKCKTAIDHLGNEYLNTSEMCQAYGINIATFYHRMKSGSSLEQALTRSASKGTPNMDHLENQYNSQAEMAQAYTFTNKIR